MAKKKPVRKDPNRVPKTYIIPKPSDGIKDGEIPSIAEGLTKSYQRPATKCHRIS